MCVCILHCNFGMDYMQNDFSLDLLLDELHFFAVPEFRDEWRVLADYLDYPPDIVQEIYQEEKDFGSVHCCKKLFTDWYHSNNGIKPCSWETLVGVLKHTRFSDVSSHIQKGLVKSVYVIK